MQITDDEKLAKLEADKQAIEDSLVPKAKAWALDRGASTREFLTKEARLTVINQAAVTEQIPDQVQALRAEIGQICDAMTAEFERWSGSVDLAEAQNLAQDPRKLFLELTRTAHDAFGAALIRRGYDSGAGVHGRTSQTATWHFYIPETGTARNSYVRYSQGADEDLLDLWRSWASIAREIKATKERIQRNRAAQLWDEN